MNLGLLFIVLVTATVPVSHHLKSTLKSTYNELAQESQPEDRVSNFEAIKKKVFDYNKLGTKNDVIINQIKAQDRNSPEVKIFDDDHRTLSKTTQTQTTTILLEPIPTSFTYVSSRLFIKDYCKYKQQHESSSQKDVKLLTGIKIYDDSLSQDTLKAFTNKIVQQKEADTDSTDLNFKQYGTLPKTKVVSLDSIPSLNAAEFKEYLIKFEGFNEEDLEFLEGNIELDHGVEEIEQELNKIKDRKREEDKVIDIIGENSSTSLIPRAIKVIYFLFFLFI